MKIYFTEFHCSFWILTKKIKKIEVKFFQGKLELNLIEKCLEFLQIN